MSEQHQPQQRQQPQQDFSPATFYAHRTALALNNMAVGMLQREQVKAAIATFGEALQLIQTAFRSDTSASSLQALADKRYTEALRRASTSREDRSAYYEVHTIDDEDLRRLRSAAMYGASSTVVFLVLIRSADTNDGRNDVQRQLGCLLYNQGVAHWIVALQREEAESQKRLLEAFRQLKAKGRRRRRRARTNDEDYNRETLQRVAQSLKLAVACFSHDLERLDDENEDDAVDDIDALLRNQVTENLPLVLLAALTHSILGNVLRTQQNVQQAEESVEQLSNLCSIVDSDAVSWLVLQPRELAAAA